MGDASREIRPSHALEGLRLEHAALGKGELEDRVVGNGLPVDQLLDHVAVDPERKHRRDRLHGQTIGRLQPSQLGDPVQIPSRVDLEAPGTGHGRAVGSLPQRLCHASDTPLPVYAGVTEPVSAARSDPTSGSGH